MESFKKKIGTPHISNQENKDESLNKLLRKRSTKKTHLSEYKEMSDSIQECTVILDKQIHYFLSALQRMNYPVAALQRLNWELRH